LPEKGCYSVRIGWRLGVKLHEHNPLFPTSDLAFIHLLHRGRQPAARAKNGREELFSGRTMYTHTKEP
jgi:hypothetical protein